MGTSEGARTETRTFLMVASEEDWSMVELGFWSLLGTGLQACDCESGLSSLSFFPDFNLGMRYGFSKEVVEYPGTKGGISKNCIKRCTEQREELQKRQAKLDAGDEKIRELISVHDQRKDESIERTFKGVARHFREVFSELVPRGHGHLVMMKKKDGGHDDDEDDEDGPRKANP
ncbi:hypothetical protein AHAS_Ahas12G0044800 [Arachis hypogaea]